MRLSWPFASLLIGLVVASFATGGCREGAGLEDHGRIVELRELLPWGAREADAGSEPDELVAPSREPASPGETKVVLLGTGTPEADPARSGPAVAVIAGKRAYVVDLGPGVVRRIAAARRAGLEELDLRRLTNAFVTHLHSDHTAGMADFMLSPWVLGRRWPLRIHGPPGIDSMVRHLRMAYRRDIAVRRRGPHAANDLGYRATGVVVAPGLVYRDRRVSVTAFPVRHGYWRYAYGYRFRASDRTIVVSGDTGPTEAVVDACKGCDVLVHEVYCKAGFERLAKRRQSYHLRSHTSTHELAEIASRARPKLLVLYHQLLWGCTEAQLMGEIRSLYDGPVAYGRDLDVY
jgi:ribonuclease BN (tRNA processing enzyme)